MWFMGKVKKNIVSVELFPTSELEDVFARIYVLDIVFAESYTMFFTEACEINLLFVFGCSCGKNVGYEASWHKGAGAVNEGNVCCWERLPQRECGGYRAVACTYYHYTSHAFTI
jgi:hypothetical protein